MASVRLVKVSSQEKLYELYYISDSCIVFFCFLEEVTDSTIPTCTDGIKVSFSEKSILSVKNQTIDG